MFIENGFKGLHRPWMYLVGSILAFFTSQIGGIFLVFFVGMQLTKEGRSIDQIANPNVLMSTLDSNLTLFLMLLGFFFGLVVLFLIVRRLHKQKIKDLTTTRKKVDFGRIRFGFLLVAIPTIALTLVDYYLNRRLSCSLIYILSILSIIAMLFIPIQTNFESIFFGIPYARNWISH